MARRQAVSRRAVLQGRGSRESSASKAPSSWQVAAPAPQKGDLGRGPGMSSTDRWREGRRTVVLTEGLRGALEAFVLITATFPKTLQGQWEGITRSSLVTKKTGRVRLKFQRNSEGTPQPPETTNQYEKTVRLVTLKRPAHRSQKDLKTPILGLGRRRQTSISCTSQTFQASSSKSVKWTWRELTVVEQWPPRAPTLRHL